MDQNHWDFNDENQNDNADVTTSAANTPSIHHMQQEKTHHKKSGGRLWILLTSVLLCAALCFAAGMGGSMLANSLQSGGTSQGLSGNTAPGFETDADTVGNQTSSGVDLSNRNPLPEMDKSQALETVTYTGSAGENAYDTLAEAYASVADTVVEIATETVVNGGWLGNYVTGGAGSGVIISTDGYIVTNHHVIDGADNVTVRLKDGTTYAAVVVGADENSDIAVLWVDAPNELPAASLGCSDDLIVGEAVFAIGNPLGSLGGTLTDGIISATARRITIDGHDMTLLQTNAAINPGNSGGGLFNMAGELIGVVNAKCSQEDVEGLGFAIPVDTAYDVICQLIQYGFVRGVVDSGLTFYDAANSMTARRYFNSTRVGTYIVESQYSEELCYGDYLVSIDGMSVTGGAAAEELLSSYSVGDTVVIEVIRLVTEVQNGKQVSVEKTIEVELVLQEYVPDGVDVRFDVQS